MENENLSLLSTAQAAERVNLSPRTLEKFRLTGEGPKFIKLGKRRVVYTLEDLISWVNNNRHSSTSDERALSSG